MPAAARYKALSVTVPAEMEQALADLCRREIRKKSEVVQEALRLYFRVRGGRAGAQALASPGSEEDRRHTDLSAFAPEWASPLDAAYDDLGK